MPGRDSTGFKAGRCVDKTTIFTRISLPFALSFVTICSSICETTKRAAGHHKSAFLGTDHRSRKISTKSVNTYFATLPDSRRHSTNNFGDDLTVPLLRELFGVDARRVGPARAELIAVGSILDSYWRTRNGRPLALWQRRPWRKLHVWGSGWPQSVRYHAVRGPLSAARIGRPDLPTGDPAILLPLIWLQKAARTAEVGVIPHFATWQKFIGRFGDILSRGWRIINLLEPARMVAQAIAECEFVVSSSLHGLIVADSYGVPSLRMAPDAPIKGDGFKFQDYFAFRGAAIAGPVGFAEFLAEWRTFVAATECRSRSASDAGREVLLRAFPFK